MLQEFKKFAMRGNVMDMAVGIIIGSAFGKIVDSMVKDVLMPALGMFLGKVDFSNFFVVLKKGSVLGPYRSLNQAMEAGAITVNVGLFINTLISFTIVAFAIFLLIRVINRLDKNSEISGGIKETKFCPECFEKIDIRATRCSHCTADISKKK